MNQIPLSREAEGLGPMMPSNRRENAKVLIPTDFDEI